MYIITLPLKIKITKTKYFSLTVNKYKSANIYMLNNIRVAFNEFLKEEIIKLPYMKKIRVHYIFYPGARLNYFIHSYIPIIDKLFIDALVLNKKIKENNYKYYIGMTTQFGEIDPDNPRIETYIEPIE